MDFTKTTKPLHGELTVPGDKSISHRSVMFGSLSDGITEVHGFLNGADCLSSMNCFREMGVTIDDNGDTVLIHGKGLHGLSAPSEVLDTGNSGTTTRLISGILAGQSFESHLIGDASICKRPMGRIMKPLQAMGADIASDRGNDCAPLTIKGHPLNSDPLRFTGSICTGKILCSCWPVCMPMARCQCDRTGMCPGIIRS